MADDKDWVSASFWNFATGGMVDECRYVSEEIAQSLQSKFDIPDESMKETRFALDFGARSYWQETGRAKIDQTAHRKKLNSLQKAAMRLTAEIDKMPPDTWQTINDSGAGRTLGNVPFPRLALYVPGENGSIKAELQFEWPDTKAIEHLNLDLLAAAANALAECAANAKKMVGEGKRGRPQDDGMFDLMMSAYLVWVRVLGRDFRLDWTDDRSPITDAARFSFAVAHAVDPSLPPSRIVTASLKARDFGKETLHLQEPSEIVEFFSKRMK